jgi:hypothetical protein
MLVAGVAVQKHRITDVIDGWAIFSRRQRAKRRARHLRNIHNSRAPSALTIACPRPGVICLRVSGHAAIAEPAAKFKPIGILNRFVAGQT